jgi:hypothetical protein
MANGKKGFQPGNVVGVRFSATRQPKKTGRKPTLYKQLFNNTSKRFKIELSKEDYYKVIRFLMECTPGELKKIAKDESTPMWVSNIISAIFTDIKYGKINTLNTFFNRLFGKPTQTIESEIEGIVNHKFEIDLSVLTDEELLQYNVLLEKIRENSK